MGREQVQACNRPGMSSPAPRTAICSLIRRAASSATLILSVSSVISPRRRRDISSATSDRARCCCSWCSCDVKSACNRDCSVFNSSTWSEDAYEVVVVIIMRMLASRTPGRTCSGGFAELSGIL